MEEWLKLLLLVTILLIASGKKSSNWVQYKRDGKFCFRRLWTQSLKGFSDFLRLAVPLFGFCISQAPLRWQDVQEAAPSHSPTAQPPQNGEVLFPACLSTFSGSKARWMDLGPGPRPEVTYPSQEWWWLLSSPWFFSGRAKCWCRSEGKQVRSRRKSPSKVLNEAPCDGCEDVWGFGPSMLLLLCGHQK